MQRTGDWGVYAAPGVEASSVHARKVDAVKVATDELAASSAGGELVLHRLDGTLQERRTIAGRLNPHRRVGQLGEQAPMLERPVRNEQPTFAGVIDNARREKKALDQFFGVTLTWVWPLIVSVLGPSAALLFAPSVIEQRGAMGVFFATLAWSSGVASFVVLLGPEGLKGSWGEAVVAFVCLSAGAWLAVKVGVGAYDVDVPHGKYGSNPIAQLLPYVEAAVITFGPGGAIFGALSGYFVGRWGGQLWRAA